MWSHLATQKPFHCLGKQTQQSHRYNNSPIRRINCNCWFGNSKTATHFNALSNTVGVTVISVSLSGAQGGKGLVFALQESPGRYPSLTNVLMISQISEHCHWIGLVYFCILHHTDADPWHNPSLQWSSWYVSSQSGPSWASQASIHTWLLPTWPLMKTWVMPCWMLNAVSICFVSCGKIVSQKYYFAQTKS